MVEFNGMARLSHPARHFEPNVLDVKKENLILYYGNHFLWPGNSIFLCGKIK